MDLRAVAGADTRIDAIGVDVGGTAIEVAQRGLSSMLSNRMAGLGRWSLDGAQPELRLADDLVAHLRSRERSTRPDRVVVGVAAPVWFGIAERTRLAEVLDPGRRHELVACSTTVAAAVGSGLRGARPLGSELVLVVDLEVGCSVSVVELAPDGVRERCAAGVGPQLRPDDGAPRTRRSERVVADLFEQARSLGCTSVDRVLAIGCGRPDLDRLLAAAAAWTSCPVEMASGRSLVARGAAFLADPVGTLGFVGATQPATDAVSGTVSGTVIDEVTDEVTNAAATAPTAPVARATGGTFELVGVLSRRVGVLMDDQDGVAIVHPVIDRGAQVPSAHEQLFDLGPDDGSDVYLDVFEQIDLASGTSPADHRLVATAHLRSAGRRTRSSVGSTTTADAAPGDETTVVFELGADGRFELGPAQAWSLDWHHGPIDVVAVAPHLVDPAGPGVAGAPLRRPDRSVVRPLIASWAVERPTVRHGAVGPTAQPVEPASEPVAEPMSEPAPGLVTEPAREPATDPAREPAAGSASDQAGEPALEPAAASAPERADDDAADHAGDAARPAEPADVEPATGADAAPAQELDEGAMADVVALPDEVPVPTPPSPMPAATTPRDAAPSPLPATPPVAAALQRCERLLSVEVGQMVALRSVFALLDLPDDASPAEIDAAAGRLERSLAQRSGTSGTNGGSDDLADAIRSAIDATRRTVRDGGASWFFGGTAAEVDEELARVVDHLMVVVGVVSAAEQRRLVLDAQLLGLGAEQAARRVRDLVLDAQAARLHDQSAVGDVGCRTVRWHPELGRFVLDPRVPPVSADVRRPDTGPSGRPTDGEPEIRMRVLLDVR